jgi:hypothetical protein
MLETAMNATAMGDAFGTALGTLVSGERNFASVVGRLSEDLIDKFARQAILSAIAKATQSAPGPLAIFAASAAAASMKAIVGKFTRKSMGGVSAAQSYSTPEYVGRQSGERMQLSIVGKLTSTGRDLEATLRENSTSNIRTRA